ncbi:PREDICTED: insulin-like growth factor 2 mRNA-binding protein 3 isoform X7 [Branchiostoma belcheri]|uniref:Insulin-like growth factor 2 mRNA-binding protein 3 isoform X7 n=1 Tax=Branchiostoma belcheri TaxID=7741 RepID=A0A6P4ZH25_BRABE|nr:PREDICTED: insulin-like growth factor 2 mRNA-binding protein 3 isoform X7 [Branchiostoma belcheri]
MATKLYFGNLSPDITLDMLKNLLLEYDVPIVPDTVQLKNHFAFVEVQDNATAEETIRKLHGYNFHGSVMTVEHSVQRNRGRSRTTKVSISNIPNQATDEDIRHLAATFGTIKECHTHEMNETKTANVTYEAPEQAAQAVNHLRGHKYCEGSYLDVNYVNENGGRNYYRNRYNPGGGNQGYGGYGNRIQGQSQDFPLRMLVPNVMVGAIIGKGGQTIRTITGATKAKVDVHRKENMGQEKPITIYGSPEACSEACRKILEIMQQESNATTAQSTDDERSDPPSSEDVPLKLLAHNSLVGRLIGKAGVTLKKIMQDSNTRISISNMQELTLYNWERTVTISGEVNAQCKAEKFIMQKLRASYEADMQNITTEPNAMPGNPAMFPGILPPAAAALAMQQQMQQPQPSEKSDLWVPGGVVGALIGPGGQNIRSASRQANATIKIAPADQSAQGQGERKVSITGSPDAQWKVQWWVFTKVGQEAYAGNDVVVLRAEIPVPSNMVGRIIGKRGASVQGLQKNTSARIEVPRNKQGDENGEVPVTIVGNFYAVQSAQRQIRKLVTQAQQQQQGQGPMQRRQPGPPKHVNMQ